MKMRASVKFNHHWELYPPKTLDEKKIAHFEKKLLWNLKMHKQYLK